VNFIFLIRVFLILCNCYRKATQEHGLNREVVNVLCQFIDATPSEIEVDYPFNKIFKLVKSLLNLPTVQLYFFCT